MPAGLATYIIRRLLLLPVILLIVSFATFALGRYAPADYVEIQAGPRAQPETIERIREERGLNDPVPVQYLRYLGNVLTGDLGVSTHPQGFPVEDVIFPRMWISLQYNAVVLVLTFAVGLPVGTWAALRRGTWQDPLSIGVFLLFSSVPVLISVPLLQWLFAVRLGVLPSGGWSEAEYFGVEIGIFSKHAVLPVLALTLPGVAGIARYMRGQVLEVLDQDFVRTANAKGLKASTVVTRHVARNALLPIVTILGFELAALIGGSIFIETLLGIPGIGLLAFESIKSRDYDTIMAIVLVGSTIFVLTMLLVDIVYGFIDPRIRVEGSVS
jgi:ABC-type dipeptide/oligopeptide/nickel transport system permease component